MISFFHRIKLGIQKFRRLMASNDRYIKLLRKSGITIGEGCEISKSVQFGFEPYLISIGNNVRITQNVRFITHDGGLWTLRKMGLIDEKMVKYGDISIGDNCNISWEVMIMPNVHIGNNCVIAAGAVVTKDIPDGEIWGGIPAKKIEDISEYYSKIKYQMIPTNGLSPIEKEKYLRDNKPELFCGKTQ